MGEAREGHHAPRPEHGGYRLRGLEALGLAGLEPQGMAAYVGEGLPC
ncbi:MAG TPA: hypothetical protein VLK32_08875 [Bacillota bacterium]|nr:hypothetical protein [Bacillota bacterium]